MADNWVSCSANSALPPYTISGGYDSDGTPIFVGRAEHEGELLAAKVVPSKGCAYVAWGGSEHVKYQYELLTGTTYGWMPSEHGGVPPTSVLTGYDSQGQPLYIGRAYHNGSLSVGKVHSSHGCLYIPYGGQEIRLSQYEVLVRAPVDNWLPVNLEYPPPGSVLAGHDSDGCTIYVGRAEHNGLKLPCKFLPDRHEAYVAHEGSEISKYAVEVLVGHNYTWQQVHEGFIPPNAVSTGDSHSGEPMYVGRANHNGSLTPGLIMAENNCLLLPYGGREVCVGNYEVLVRNN
uniref:Uncharacterized protein n=1 Tax=Stomoxys calcitrans TaxID=35570 RepID=A0A1I8PFC2_STOCA